jgi:hypothetical protein
MPNATDSQIEILCTITTRDEAGVHFTQKFEADDLSALESAGLIAIDRPIHKATGIAYGCDEWSVEVTQDGLDLVEAN